MQDETQAEIPPVTLGILVTGNPSKLYSCWLASHKISPW